MSGPKRNYKSGSEKKHLHEKEQLEMAGRDPKQAKLSHFFQSTSTSATSSSVQSDIFEESNIPSTSSDTQRKEVGEGTNAQGTSTISQPKKRDIVMSKLREQQNQSIDSKRTKMSHVQEIATTGQSKRKHTGSLQEEAHKKKQSQTSSFVDFKTDKALFKTSFINDEEKLILLREGPCQPEESDMPDRKFPRSKDGRFFKQAIYHVNKNKLFGNVNVKSSWFAYSPREDYAYCHYCWLFGNEDVKKSSWSTGYTDWKHVAESAIIHSKSKNHILSCVAVSTFLSNRDIKQALNTQADEEIRKWKEVLNVLLDTVKTLTGAGIALRGHRESIHSDENPGIYLTIINLIARHNPTMKHHLESSGKIKYLSKTITNELLSILANKTRDAILKESKEAKFYTLLVDSTTDIAHLDQMAIMLRYVTLNENDSPRVQIRERFICFVNIKQGDALSICQTLADLLFEKYVLDKTLMCGQAYDGASVMSGKYGGLQAKMKECIGEETFAPYVHCAAHQINLVLVHAAEHNASPSIKLFFATIQRIYNYFAHSHRRWNNLLDATQKTPNLVGKILMDLEKEIFQTRNEDEDEENEAELPELLNRDLKLKSLSTTRWASRYKAVEAVLFNFEKIVQCLAEEAERATATGDDILASKTILSLMDWTFYLNLLWWNSVLQIINTSQLVLQSTKTDNFVAQRTLETSLEKLKQMRHEETYNLFVEKANLFWMELGYDKAGFPVKRKKCIKQMPGEKVSDTALGAVDKHRVGYFEAIDRMCSELSQRIEGFTEINDIFGFLAPDRLKQLKDIELHNVVKKLNEKYKFVTDDLRSEIQCFQDVFFTSETITQKNWCVSHYLEFILKKNLEECFPEFVVVMRIFLTLPVSTASVERVMSSLKYIKQLRRSTLTEERLNDFSILYVEKKVAETLDLESIIDYFANVKVRRGTKLC